METANSDVIERKPKWREDLTLAGLQGILLETDVDYREYYVQLLLR